MNLKNKLIAHCKIYFRYTAFIEMYRSESYIIDLGVVEITIVKRAVYKGNTYKSGIGKVTVVENTPLKVGVVEDFLRVGLLGIDLVYFVFRHFAVCFLE